MERRPAAIGAEDGLAVEVKLVALVARSGRLGSLVSYSCTALVTLPSFDTILDGLAGFRPVESQLGND